MGRKSEVWQEKAHPLQEEQGGNVSFLQKSCKTSTQSTRMGYQAELLPFEVCRWGILSTLSTQSTRFLGDFMEKRTIDCLAFHTNVH